MFIQFTFVLVVLCCVWMFFVSSVFVCIYVSRDRERNKEYSTKCQHSRKSLFSIVLFVLCSFHFTLCVCCVCCVLLFCIFTFVFIYGLLRRRTRTAACLCSRVYISLRGMCVPKLCVPNFENSFFWRLVKE